MIIGFTIYGTVSICELAYKWGESEDRNKSQQNSCQYNMETRMTILETKMAILLQERKEAKK